MSIIRSDNFGWVVENFEELPAVKTTGRVYPYLTRFNKIAVWPDFESIPPRFRPYARKASMDEMARGYPMDKVVHLVSEWDEQGRLIKRYYIKEDERPKLHE